MCGVSSVSVKSLLGLVSDKGRYYTHRCMAEHDHSVTFNPTPFLLKYMPR